MPLAVVFLRRRVRAWGYLEREDDLLVRRGVMVQRLSVVPYGRMQFVEVTSGLMERVFGLVDGQAAHRSGELRREDPRARARSRRRACVTGSPCSARRAPPGL